MSVIEEKLNNLHEETKKESLPPPQPTDPVEAASLIFGMYYPKFLQLILGLSNKSLKRLIRALIGIPLEEAMPNFKNEKERAAFAIGERLLEAKTLIIIHTMYQKQKDLEKFQLDSQTENKETETNDNDNKEIKNG